MVQLRSKEKKTNKEGGVFVLLHMLDVMDVKRGKDLMNFNSASTEMLQFLEWCVLIRKNIVISGGTGSGKTTLLNITSGFIPDDERIVTVEDSAELQLQQPHWVRLEREGVPNSPHCRGTHFRGLRHGAGAPVCGSLGS